MISQTPWVERKFNFDFPVGMYPCLLERLRGTPVSLREMVAGLNDEVLMIKPNNRWSIKEHIGHLNDLEELHENRLQEFIEGKATLSAADMKNQKTEDAHHNDKSIEQLLTQLRMTRLHFVQQLEQANDDLVNRKALHPRLKVPMRLVDMVYFVCEHDDHHLAKMRVIVNSRDKF
jgi:uncharacterized damage-inducible protein DinB